MKSVLFLVAVVAIVIVISPGSEAEPEGGIDSKCPANFVLNSQGVCVPQGERRAQRAVTYNKYHHFDVNENLKLQCAKKDPPGIYKKLCGRS